jgi:hypothetical protein
VGRGERRRQGAQAGHPAEEMGFTAQLASPQGSAPTSPPSPDNDMQHDFVAILVPEPQRL